MPSRRAMLAYAAAGLLGVAGCVSDGSDSGRESTGETAATRKTSTTTTTAADTTTESTESARPDPPDLPPPEEVGVPPAEVDCPAIDDDDIVSVVCHPDGPADASVALTPSSDRAALPTAELRFTLKNSASVTFEFNPYNWRVWKQAGDEWVRLAPNTVPEPLMFVRPDGSYDWTLTVDNATLDGDAPPSFDARGEKDLRLPGLGGGTYAFGTDGNFQAAGHDYEHAVGLTARFELAGDPLELRPWEVADHSRDGRVVTARAEGASDGDRTVVARRRRATTVDPDHRAVNRVVPEQAIRSRHLRNTLPFFESDVDEVRFVGAPEAGVVSPVSLPSIVEYEGTEFVVELA